MSSVILGVIQKGFVDSRLGTIGTLALVAESMESLMNSHFFDGLRGESAAGQSISPSNSLSLEKFAF